MKTRTVLIYLAVFLVLAGYFYYFEVVRRKARLEKNEASRLLFQVDQARITALKLDRPDAGGVFLEKNGRWRIVNPINTRADAFAVDSLLTSLQSLKMERQVQAAAADLQPYGLEKPKLQLSFLETGTWHHLRVGGKAPVGDQWYSSADHKNRVVLISASQYRSLDKTLFDLREKQVFTLESEAVQQIEVERPEGKLTLARVDKDRWESPAAPDLEIATTKVESLLSSLTLLRATRFIQEDNPSRFGLAPAPVRIRLAGRDKAEILLLGEIEKEQGIYAKSNQLPGIIMVDEDLMEKLPGELSDLKDRSLLAFESENVTGLVLTVAGEEAGLERQGQNWHWSGGEKRESPETWQVNSLLWKLQNLEYRSGSPPQGQRPPDTGKLSVVLFTENDQKIGAFLLPEIPSEEQEKAVLWVCKDDNPAQPYWLSAASLADLHRTAKNLMAPES